MNRRLGCLTGGGLLAAALTLALLLLFFVATGGAMFSPGSLNAQPGEAVLGQVHSHAETGGRCTACHTPPWSSATLADRCIACHSNVGDELNGNHGLHAQLRGQATAFDCRGCHTEHRGATGELTQISADTFQHAATGYQLTGHQSMASGRAFACGDCHPQSVTEFSAATCTDCHRQLDATYIAAHVTDFGGACLNCHDGVDRYSRKRFDHNAQAFPLQGKHAAVACGKCHAGATTLADLQGAKRTCVDCHQKDDAHQGQFGTDCAGCHNATSWPDAQFDHSKTAFPLTGKHAGVKCEDCHKDGTFKGTPQNCVDCHQKDDAHKGQFGTDCGGCHNATSWPDAQFDHSKTAFPLTGKHAGVKCQDCHKDGTFKGTPQNCVDCHQKDDAHKGQFGTDCAGCHNTTSWPDAQFDHSKTTFPLTGKHAGVKCQDCHKDGTFKGTSTQCVACHADPTFHKGAFGTACADCHTAAGWQPATFNQRHTFPIDHGERGTSSCRTCHPDNVKAYTCYGCHEHTPAETIARHAEEVRGDISDCVKCHPTGQKEEGGGD